MNLRNEFNRIGHLFHDGVEKTQHQAGHLGGTKGRNGPTSYRETSATGSIPAPATLSASRRAFPPCAGKSRPLRLRRRTPHRHPDRQNPPRIPPRPAAPAAVEQSSALFRNPKIEPQSAQPSLQPSRDLPQHVLAANIVVRLVQRFRDNNKRLVLAPQRVKKSSSPSTEVTGSMLPVDQQHRVAQLVPPPAPPLAAPAVSASYIRADIR